MHYICSNMQKYLLDVFLAQLKSMKVLSLNMLESESFFIDYYSRSYTQHKAFKITSPNFIQESDDCMNTR